MSIVLTSIFGSSQHRIVSELVVRGEIGFYLRVLGGNSSRSGHIVTAFRFAFICACFHYMLGFVSKNEVIKRTDKFQAFGECLHNVASVCYKVHMYILSWQDKKMGFLWKTELGMIATAKDRNVCIAYVCCILRQLGLSFI